jgi:hypothetical protein
VPCQSPLEKAGPIRNVGLTDRIRMVRALDKLNSLRLISDRVGESCEFGKAHGKPCDLRGALDGHPERPFPRQRRNGLEQALVTGAWRARSTRRSGLLIVPRLTLNLVDEVDGKQPALGIELRIGPAVPHAAHLIPRIEFTRCIRTDDKRRLCDRDLPAFARQVSFTLDTSPRRSLPCAAGVPGAIMAVFRQNLGLTQDSQSRAIPCCAVPRLGRVTW